MIHFISFRTDIFGKIVLRVEVDHEQDFDSNGLPHSLMPTLIRDATASDLMELTSGGFLSERGIKGSVVIPLKPTPEIIDAMLRAFTTCDIDEVLSGRYTITNNVEAAYAALVKEVSK